jgi:hypothetical protein
MSQKDDFRRFFQDAKKMTQEKFNRTMNMMHSNAWHLCYRQFGEAMDIALQPKQKQAVMDKFKMIATEWDGIKEIVVDLQAISEDDFMEVVQENRRIGYGRMMQLISEHWRKEDPLGALSLGPCYGTFKEEKTNDIR